jgi:hypothetical protein
MQGSVTHGRLVVIHKKSGRLAIAEFMRGIQIGETYKKEWIVVDHVMVKSTPKF